MLRFLLGLCMLSGSLAAVSLEEAVPTLFMVADYADAELYCQERAKRGHTDQPTVRELADRVDRLVSEKNIGGVLFKGMWTPTGLAARIRHLKSVSSGPLLFAQDLEWGLSMRHFGAVEMPKALCMGAISDDTLLEAWADVLAKTAREVGITCFLGPVADTNTNPKNPIIHDRSFGDDPATVAHKVNVVVSTLRRHGLLVCLKHFPGHGDTSQDSHTHLPVVEKTWDQLLHEELVPFRSGIDAQADCVMTAHISFPRTPGGATPASLSPFWCQVLRNELGFHGVVITDDLIMAGACDTRTYAQTAVQALKAGNDLCIVSFDVEGCIDGVLKAVEAGELKEESLYASITKVRELQAHALPPEEPSALPSQIQLHNLLYQKALTAVGGRFQFSPSSTLLLQVGDSALCPLIRDLVQAYPASQVEAWRRQPRQEEIDGLFSALKKKTDLLVVLCDLERSASRSFGISEELLKGLQRVVDTGTKVRYVIFGSPYVLPLLPKPVTGALVAYENTPGSERAVFLALSGVFEPTGVLPVRP